MAFLKESQTSGRAGIIACSTLVFFCACLAGNVIAAEDAAQLIKIHSSLDEPGTESDWFAVTGVPPKTIESLSDAELSTADWKRIFSISVDQPDLTRAIEQPAMAGKYTIDGSAINFAPRFPLSPGNAYRATFYPRALPDSIQLSKNAISRLFESPMPENTQPTSVTAIYPSTNVLPENLLKFYVHFSAPMSGDRVHRHIQLINEKTGPVELPFLELDDALWNIDMTQLTLFIDPGRIKREVKPLEDIGPSLLAGLAYQLVIDQNWLDANGNRLSETYAKPFEVEAPDRSAPAIEQWKLTLPTSTTRNPLVVNFGESMDYALAQRMIRLETDRGQEIHGFVSLGEQETEWRFVPDEPWSSGKYELAVQSTIEDLAGNNIGKLFEVDLRRETGFRPLPKFARRSFEIR